MRGEPVVLAPLVVAVASGAPVGKLDEAALEEPVEDAVQVSGPEPDASVGALADGLRDPVSVQRGALQRGELRVVFGPSKFRLDRILEDVGKDPFEGD